MTANPAAILMLAGYFDKKCRECGKPMGPFAWERNDPSDKDPELCAECEARA